MRTHAAPTEAERASERERGRGSLSSRVSSSSSSVLPRGRWPGESRDWRLPSPRRRSLSGDAFVGAALLFDSLRAALVSVPNCSRVLGTAGECPFWDSAICSRVADVGDELVSLIVDQWDDTDDVVAVAAAAAAAACRSFVPLSLSLFRFRHSCDIFLFSLLSFVPAHFDSPPASASFLPMSFEVAP